MRKIPLQCLKIVSSLRVNHSMACKAPSLSGQFTFQKPHASRAHQRCSDLCEFTLTSYPAKNTWPFYCLQPCLFFLWENLPLSHPVLSTTCLPSPVWILLSQDLSQSLWAGARGSVHLTKSQGMLRLLRVQGSDFEKQGSNSQVFTDFSLSFEITL